MFLNCMVLCNLQQPCVFVFLFVVAVLCLFGFFFFCSVSFEFLASLKHYAVTHDFLINIKNTHTMAGTELILMIQGAVY